MLALRRCARRCFCAESSSADTTGGGLGRLELQVSAEFESELLGDRVPSSDDDMLGKWPVLLLLLLLPLLVLVLVLPALLVR